eukprot:2465945-Prymnesium_polylepis.1
MEPNMWLTLRQLGIQSSYRGSSSAPSSPAAQGVVDSIERIVVNVFQAQETLVAAVSNTVELDDVHARQSAVAQSREETQADIPGRLTTAWVGGLKEGEGALRWVGVGSAGQAWGFAMQFACASDLGVVEKSRGGAGGSGYWDGRERTFFLPCGCMRVRCH